MFRGGRFCLQLPMDIAQGSVLAAKKILKREVGSQELAAATVESKDLARIFLKEIWNIPLQLLNRHRVEILRVSDMSEATDQIHRA